MSLWVNQRLQPDCIQTWAEEDTQLGPVLTATTHTSLCNNVETKRTGRKETYSVSGGYDNQKPHAQVLLLQSHLTSQITSIRLVKYKGFAVSTTRSLTCSSFSWPVSKFRMFSNTNMRVYLQLKLNITVRFADACVRADPQDCDGERVSSMLAAEHTVSITHTDRQTHSLLPGVI